MTAQHDGVKLSTSVSDHPGELRLSGQVAKTPTSRVADLDLIRAFPVGYRLVGLVVKVSASRAEDSGFESRLRRDIFVGSSQSSDLKNGTPVATLPGAWRYIGSVLGLVGPVSVYCDWVRLNV